MMKDCESATGTTRMSEKNGMDGKAGLRRVKIGWTSKADASRSSGGTLNRKNYAVSKGLLLETMSPCCHEW